METIKHPTVGKPFKGAKFGVRATYLHHDMDENDNPISFHWVHETFHRTEARAQLSLAGVRDRDRRDLVDVTIITY